MKTLLTVALTLLLAGGAFLSVNYLSEKNGNARPDTADERDGAADADEEEVADEESAAEPAKVAELKSLIPNDDFCRIVGGEVDAGASDLYANGSDGHAKYARIYGAAGLAPVPAVACPLQVDGAGTVVYARFVPNQVDESVAVEIYGANGNLKQTLVSQYPSNMVSSLRVHDDVNFDGYHDALLTDIVGASNAVQSYYTYDSASGTFAPREDLAGLSLSTFDPQARTIQTYTHGSAVTGSSATLQLIGDRYVITKIVSVDFDGPTHEINSRLVEVTKELKDGILATTSVTYKTF